MNLIVSVDERVVERAREVARSLGKSLNQLVREYFEQPAGRDRPRPTARSFAACRSGVRAAFGAGALIATTCMSGRSFPDTDIPI